MKINFSIFGIILISLIVFASGISEIFSLENDQNLEILLIGPNFFNVKISNIDQVFKFLYEIKNGNIVSIDVLNDESMILIDVDGNNAELQLNIPRNFPISDYPEGNSETPIILVDNTEVAYDVQESDCFYEYHIDISNSSQIKFIFFMTYDNSLGGTIEEVPEYCFKETMQKLDSLSPLKQFKMGVILDKIQCKEHLVLIIKHDGYPACVKPETKIKLIERGWAR